MLQPIPILRIALILSPILVVSPSVKRLLAEDAEFRHFDGFEGEFALQWETIRSVEDHVSLTKNPGKLTITTAYGTLGMDEIRRGPANNVHLIENPSDEEGDFVVTTCIESFNPSRNYQQAGLLVYDDDDNYLKYDIEFNKGTLRFKHMRETNQTRIISESEEIVPEAEKIWLRLTKRGNVYERAYSVDGKEFTSEGETTWGDGMPEFTGLIAVNGTSTRQATDAIFDFFEVRSLTEQELNDPRHLERQKLKGTWDVVDCIANGEKLADAYGQFQFDDGRVVFVEKTQTITVDYTLNVSKDPKAITMAAFTPGSKGEMNGSYLLIGDSLTICLSLDPGRPAPDKLESPKGDRRLLLKLKKPTEEDDQAPADASE